jgi:hypothetical protein
MSPSGQHTSEQQKEIGNDTMMTYHGASDVYEQVDGKEVLHTDNKVSVLSKVLKTTNNKYEHKCLNGLIRLLNVHPTHQSIDDIVPGYRYSIPGRPRCEFLVHRVWDIWFTMRGWVWDTDMVAALVAYDMGLGNTFTSVEVAMLWKLVLGKSVMGLPLYIVWQNTLEE